MKYVVDLLGRDRSDIPRLCPRETSQTYEDVLNYCSVQNRVYLPSLTAKGGFAAILRAIRWVKAISFSSGNVIHHSIFLASLAPTTFPVNNISLARLAPIIQGASSIGGPEL